ncbi:MAG: 4Fe-4S dicluster domain-containing protein [bacterium]|nr:4Fe-4S dicluster domain-containing protein [bacterium]
MYDSYASINFIRRQVFKEVAKIAYSGNYEDLNDIPYIMLNGKAKYRESIFLERAIVAERIRLAIGLPVRSADEHGPLSKGIHEAIKPERFYTDPLINVIDFACNACPTESYYVSDSCVGCLANPCSNICKVGAIKIVNGRSVINQDICVKCGKCKEVCPYDAIIHRQRPCEKACEMHAIESDSDGKAKINYEKCVACGMCIVNCPFGAIADKSQIVQVIEAIKSDTKVYAIVAPAFSAQFGPKVTLDNIGDCLKQLGFDDFFEVAIGADLCSIDEAHEFMEKVPNEIKFMATSCCPSWSRMAKHEFPEFKDNISMTLTPMILTAKAVKTEHPNSKVVFIGPCSAKKLEVLKKKNGGSVDFVLTFEELMGMIQAKDIDLSRLESTNKISDSSPFGKGFAVTGGVAKSVLEVIKEKEPNREVKTYCAKGLEECRKMLKDAKNGLYDGYLLEGMACHMGCVSGAGTISVPNKAKVLIEMEMKKDNSNPLDSKYADKLDIIRKYKKENESD